MADTNTTAALPLAAAALCGGALAYMYMRGQQTQPAPARPPPQKAGASGTGGSMGVPGGASHRSPTFGSSGPQEMFQYDDEFLKRIPKTDLHVHLDGSLRLSTLIELAQKYNVELPAYDEAGLRELVFKEKYDSLEEVSSRAHCCL